MKLIFIRHAEPNYEIDSLTQKGWHEAELLSDRVAGWNASAFYCSPLGRAKDTASFSVEKTGIPLQILPWLQEFYYRVKDPITGQERIAWDFMPSYFNGQAELHDQNKWMETDVMSSGAIKENYLKVCDGLDCVLQKHGYVREDGGFYSYKEHNDETLVFFCHLGVSFVMLGHLLGIAPPVLWQGFFVAPSSVTVLGSEEREPGIATFRVQFLGDARHLSNANEPISEAGYFTDTFQL